jgi:uncharacterized protein
MNEFNENKLFNKRVEHGRETRPFPHLNLVQDKREEIISIAAKHGAFNIRIFGSVARNEADDNNEIDFLIDYSIDDTSPWFPAGLELDLEELLGRKVNVVTEDALEDRIRARI